MVVEEERCKVDFIVTRFYFLSISTNQQGGKWLEWRLDNIFVNAVKVVRFWFWHEAVNDSYELKPVDYIHFWIPYSEMALLGNLPTFFNFGITLLPLKKKSLANFTSLIKENKDFFDIQVCGIQSLTKTPFFWWLIVSFLRFLNNNFAFDHVPRSYSQTNVPYEHLGQKSFVDIIVTLLLSLIFFKSNLNRTQVNIHLNSIVGM